MISPSFIGFELPAGAHQIRAEYSAGSLKAALLFAGAAVVLALFFLDRRLIALDARFATPSPRRARR